MTDLSYHGSGSGLFTSSLDGEVRLFDLRSSTSTAALAIPHAPSRDGSVEEISCLTAGHSDNSPLVASGSTSGYVKQYDIRHPTLVVSSFAHYNTVCSLESSLDDSMITSSSLDGTIRLWSTRKGDCLLTVNEGTSNNSPCVYSGFTADGEGLIGLFLDSSVRRWSMKDRLRSQRTILGPKISNSTKTFTRIDESGGIAIPSEDGTVHFLNAMTGKLIQDPTKAHADDVLSVDCRGDLMVSTGAGEDSSAVLWVRLLTDSDEDVKANYKLSYNLVSPQIEGLI